jgi:large subunit ribosomal protein L4
MVSLDVKKPSGETAGTVDLDDALFGVEPNVAVMHQVVTAQLAARRAGTHSTKTRAEVAGGGAKPWRQKGTGRARQGSTRAPQWRGGGVALGPKPRSYRQRTPKKMIRLALASALSDRQADGKVVVLDDWGIEEPSTRRAVEVLDSLGTDGRVLVVLTRDDEAVWKSVRNTPRVHVLMVDELNAHDVLVSDWVVFTQASLPQPRAPESSDSEPTADESRPKNGRAKRRGVGSAAGGAAEGGTSPEAEHDGGGVGAAGAEASPEAKGGASS